MCYDLLCFCFYMAAFLYYLRHRHANWDKVLIWSILYICCLNSKELGVTLPAVICIYELLRRKPTQWKRWIAADGRIAIAGIAINLLFILGRIYGGGGLSMVDGYKPVYRLSVYLARAHHFLSEAFYNPHWLTPLAALLLFFVLAAMALWSRWFPFRFAVAWMPVAILPVAFIPERGLDSATIAALGLAMAIALIFTEISRHLFPFKERQAAQFVACCCSGCGKRKTRPDRFRWSLSGGQADPLGLRTDPHNAACDPARHQYSISTRPVSGYELGNFVHRRPAYKGSLGPRLPPRPVAQRGHAGFQHRLVL